MDPRERGVAHVNIFWALVPLVLMLGAGGYAYMKHVEADEAVAAKVEATAESRIKRDVVQHRDKQLEELTALLGNADKFKDPTTPIEGYTAPNGYTTPESLKRVFDVFKTKVGLAPSFTTLDAIVNAAGAELQARKDLVANLEKQLGDVRNELAAAQSATDTVRGDLQGQLGAANATIQGERKKLDDEVKKGSELVAEARKKTQQLIEEKKAVEEASNQAISKKENELMQASAALANLTSKVSMINSPDQPDGRVLSSSDQTGLAWIDIGGKDMVKTGMNFRILERVQSGLRQKGHGVVTLVERDRAQIRVLGLVNPLNPVVRNDFIANDLYSKDVKRNVYLVGRFVAPLSKPEIKRILEDMGNKVLDKMSPQVDLVIVGREELGEDATPIAETEDFLNATRWNIEVASINKIRDFLRL